MADDPLSIRDRLGLVMMATVFVLLVAFTIRGCAVAPEPSVHVDTALLP